MAAMAMEEVGAEEVALEVEGVTGEAAGMEGVVGFEAEVVSTADGNTVCHCPKTSTRYDKKSALVRQGSMELSV